MAAQDLINTLVRAYSDFLFRLELEPLVAGQPSMAQYVIRLSFEGFHAETCIVDGDVGTFMLLLACQVLIMQCIHTDLNMFKPRGIQYDFFCHLSLSLQVCQASVDQIALCWRSVSRHCAHCSIFNTALNEPSSFVGVEDKYRRGPHDWMQCNGLSRQGCLMLR